MVTGGRTRDGRRSDKMISDGTPPTGPDDGVHAELVAIDDAWSRAIVSNDAERIGDFMADDWVIVSESGVASKDDFLSLIASGELTHSAMDQVGEARVKVYEQTAVLTARATNTAHYRDRRFDADEWTTSVYVRRDGQWRCVLSHITPAVRA
jgi:ketosteroid isomerase-like protein